MLINAFQSTENISCLKRTVRKLESDVILETSLVFTINKIMLLLFRVLESGMTDVERPPLSLDAEELGALMTLEKSYISSFYCSPCFQEPADDHSSTPAAVYDISAAVNGFHLPKSLEHLPQFA